MYIASKRDYETAFLPLNVVLKLSCLTNLSGDATLARVYFEWPRGILTKH